MNFAGENGKYDLHSCELYQQIYMRKFYINFISAFCCVVVVIWCGDDDIVSFKKFMPSLYAYLPYLICVSETFCIELT